jgi:hypothetical protein
MARKKNKNNKDDKIFNNKFVLGGGFIEDEDIFDINFSHIETSSTCSIDDELENDYLIKIKSEYDALLKENNLFRTIYFSNLKNIPVIYYRDLFYTLYDKVDNNNVSVLFSFVSCCELLKLKLDVMMNYLKTNDKIRIYKSLLEKYPRLKNKINKIFN